MEEQKTYTPEQIAKILQLSKITVYSLIKKGQIHAHKFGKQYRISQHAINQYLHSQPMILKEPSSIHYLAPYPDPKKKRASMAIEDSPEELYKLVPSLQKIISLDETRNPIYTKTSGLTTEEMISMAADEQFTEKYGTKKENEHTG